MKKNYKIVILSICLLIALSWVCVSVFPFFENITEKHITEKKEALPESELELDEKTFEVVYAFSPSFPATFQYKIASSLPFSKNINFPESLILDSLKPPPELI